MSKVGTFLQEQPAYVTGIVAGGFDLAALLWPHFLTASQFKAISGYAILVLVGWIHSTVTPNSKLP